MLLIFFPLLGPEKDKHWLSMQLRGFSYLTKSYFPYLYEYNEPQNVETLFLSLIHGSSDVHTEFVKIDAQDPSSLILPISKVKKHFVKLFYFHF